MAPGDVIFSPLKFRNLTIKNRVLRSSISGRIDNYDGSGTPARVNWEAKFARMGVGAIISAHVPIHVRGRILPNYAFIDKDERIPFWRKVGEAVHRHDCKFIMQISHSGRQQDIAGIENLGKHPLSSSDQPERFHGFSPQAMTRAQIADTVQMFGDAARRAREAGLDGVELHAGNGYLFSQFLSSAINDRDDEYGGCLENRARFLLDVMAAVRREVGDDFFVCVKFSPVDYNNAVIFWEGEGNTQAEGVQIARWCEEAGADALHITTGSMFPHPRNPPGGFPIVEAERSYPSILGEGTHTFRNYLLFRWRFLRPLFYYLWNRTKPDIVEGINLDDARAVKQAVSIPVLGTGGFQTGSVVRAAIEDGSCDGVTIARPLMANPDLLATWASGADLPERPCTYCNKCLINVLEHPLGCYEESRYDSFDEMIAHVMSFFEDDEGWLDAPLAGATPSADASPEPSTAAAPRPARPAAPPAKA